ncbi:hypothetical protein [Leifsonia sp. Leaf264]|uniref:hypothetical protein n=1 Tax=Leifsonia sp. Leaf264 TaxID=1736314 RepID=UPI0006FE5629|nr:hypothetical protein [Leifsonia sp. Leaf264]KQO98360.1 hypothetical protein ASF30_09885 [Leifsonia sp. Leaf264]
MTTPPVTFTAGRRKRSETPVAGDHVMSRWGWATVHHIGTPDHTGKDVAWVTPDDEPNGPNRWQYLDDLVPELDARTGVVEVRKYAARCLICGWDSKEPFDTHQEAEADRVAHLRSKHPRPHTRSTR